MKEKWLESSTEKLIRANFVYDPDYVPDWYKQGKIDYKSAKIKYPLEIYAEERSKEWNKKISPLASGLFKIILDKYSIHPANPTCFILKYRLDTGTEYQEGYSNPLAIWAIPPDGKWGYLPFHARLIHELLHEVQPRRYYGGSNWELIEDEVGKNYDHNKFSGAENQYLREELVVRHITHIISKEIFGKEFADWFLQRESKTIAPLKGPEIIS